MLYANDTTLVASISRNEVPLGETFVFTITINDGSAKVSPPEIANSKHISTSQRQSVMYNNGKKKSTKIYYYTYMTQNLGHVTISPIELTINKKKYRTEAISFDIVENTNPNPTPNTSTGNNSQNSRSRSRSRSVFDLFDEEIGDIDKEIFIRSELSRTNVYMYEPLYFEQNVYISDAVNAEIAKFDKAGEKNDFLVKRDTNRYNSRSETVDGKQYAKHILSREILFAIFSGERIVNENSYMFDISSRFIGFNDTIKLGGQSYAVNVMPLPTAGKPSSFSGGVGEFDFSISIDKDSVSKDDSFILKVMASGMGYADTLDLPNVQEMLDDKYGSTLYIYPPKQFTTNEVRGGKIYGEKVDEYMIVVKDESSAYLGNIELEPIEFSYFSPAEETYITIQSQKVELPVLSEDNITQNRNENDNRSGGVPLTSSDEDKTSDDLLRLLPMKDGNVKIRNDLILYKQSFIYLYLSVSIFILALVFLVKRFVIPRFLSSNKKPKNSLIGFENPTRYLQNGDIKTCIKEIERTFYENISIKLKQKVSNNIEMNKLFQINNIDSKTQEKASSAIETCHYILYSPIANNDDKNFMEQKCKIEDVIRAMKSVINTI